MASRSERACFWSESWHDIIIHPGRARSPAGDLHARKDADFAPTSKWGHGPFQTHRTYLCKGLRITPLQSSATGSQLSLMGGGKLWFDLSLKNNQSVETPRAGWSLLTWMAMGDAKQEIFA